jgi:tetratricopeptide (TPR) repeat protein
MKKTLCLLGALALSLSAISCTKINARIEIRDANTAYEKEDYTGALAHYVKARGIDPSFPDLDRMIGYCYIGLYQPDNKDAQNEKLADNAITELQKYLRKRPNDRVARDVLINTFLNANRTSQAIDYFRVWLTGHPADLEAVKSIATLYAKEGNFNESLNWYQKITLLDQKNPEAFYIYGVVCYEKVAKNPPADVNERMAIIEKGKSALQTAIGLRPDYAEAMAYLNLLFRQQALVETNPAKQQEYIKQADEIRNRAVEILKARKAGTAPPSAPGAPTPKK